MSALVITDVQREAIARITAVALTRRHTGDLAELTAKLADIVEEQTMIIGDYIMHYAVALAPRDGMPYRFLGVSSYTNPGRRVPQPVIEELCLAFGFRHHMIDGWASYACPCGCGAVNTIQRLKGGAHAQA